MINRKKRLTVASNEVVELTNDAANIPKYCGAAENVIDKGLRVLVPYQDIVFQSFKSAFVSANTSVLGSTAP